MPLDLMRVMLVLYQLITCIEKMKLDKEKKYHVNFALKSYQTSMYGSGMRTLNIEKAKQKILNVLTAKMLFQ